MEMSNIIFETDAKLVFDAISSTKFDFSEFGFIINFCKTIINQEQTYSVSHVKRQANTTTHTAAKASCFIASPFLWFDPPSFMLSVLGNDYVSYLSNNN